MHYIIHEVALSNPRVNKGEGTVTFDATVPLSTPRERETLATAEIVRDVLAEAKNSEDIHDAEFTLLVTRPDDHELPKDIAEGFVTRMRQITAVEAVEEMVSGKGPKQSG